MIPVLYRQITSLGTARGLGYLHSTVTGEAVTASGAGYHQNDVITVAGGTFLLPATYRVTQVSGGGSVISLTRTNSGSATAKPSNAAATTVSPSGGSGLTLTLTWADNVAPDGVQSAVIQAEAQALRWRDDGGTPTATVGNPIAAGDSITYRGPGLSAMKLIESASGGIANITFYR